MPPASLQFSVPSSFHLPSQYLNSHITAIKEDFHPIFASPFIRIELDRQELYKHMLNE